jgi:hypothetical protein
MRMTGRTGWTPSAIEIGTMRMTGRGAMKQ